MPSTYQLPQSPRPLEFRVWHIPTQTMYYGIDFNEALVTFRWDATKSDTENYKVVDKPLLRSECIIMQYTGVRDRKGKKIWEGDILFWSALDKKENLRFDQYDVVHYRSGTFGTDGNEYEPIVSLCRANSLRAKGRHYQTVVGNVYQQEHLLSLAGDFPISPTSVTNPHLTNIAHD